MNKYEVVYPLDTIQFVSGNKKLYLFINFLFERASDFNAKMKLEEGEDYFPIAKYDAKSFSYHFEFEFLVESYVEYVKEFYDISNESESNLYQYLYFNTDKKIKRARYIFFAIILGGYYTLGSGYYNDPCKNKGLVYFDCYVKNAHGILAHSSFFQIASYMEKYVKKELTEPLKSEKTVQVAYARIQMNNYKSEHDISSVPKIYDLGEI